MVPSDGEARVGELEAELAALKRALRAGGIGIYDWDLASGEILWSDELLDMIGRDGAKAPRGDSVLDLIHPEDRSAAQQAIDQAIASGAPIDTTFRVTRDDGRTRWIASRGAVERDEQGQAIRILGVNFDVSEPYVAEQELRENQQRLQGLMEDLPGVIFYQVITSRDMRERDYVYISPNAVKVLGVSPEHLASAPGEMMGQVQYEDLAEVLAKERAAAAAMETLEVEIAGIRRDGKVVRTRVISRPRPTEEGRLLWDGVLIDITDRVEAEAALEESEERFRGMADNLPILCWWADAAGYIYWYNKRWWEYTGTTPGQMEGWGWQKVHHPSIVAEVTERWSASIVSGEPFEMVFPLRSADGEYRQFLTRARPLRDESGAIVRWFGTNTDVTDQLETEAALRRTEQELRLLNDTLERRVAQEVLSRLEAEEALRQAQKMETLGQLTGGVAHDFNNLLQIISGNLGMVQRGLPADAERLRRSVDNAVRGAERAAVLTQRLLAFSRRQPLAPRPIDLNGLVANMSELLHRSLGETVEVATALAPSLWTAEADPNQLENALLNLAVNARDAMEAGGKLTIETCNAVLDDAYAAVNPEAEPGEYVAISVSDTGCGMSEETAARAIEPFFTSKEVGKGTGLGLSMVYGFTKQSGGHLKIYSEEGHGTTVKIYLPRLKAEAESAQDQMAPSQTAPARGETVLVCEDDEDVRAFSVQILTDLGYQVVEAEDGPSALRHLEVADQPIDLLFTDVVLPNGLTGAELAKEAQLHRPGLKVLFTTGYARNAIVHHGRLDPGVELITKPFSQADLAARVRSLLDKE